MNRYVLTFAAIVILGFFPATFSVAQNAAGNIKSKPFDLNPSEKVILNKIATSCENKVLDAFDSKIPDNAHILLVPQNGEKPIVMSKDEFLDEAVNECFSQVVHDSQDPGLKRVQQILFDPRTTS